MTTKHSRRPTRHSRHRQSAHPTGIVPASVQEALKEAMRAEKVPEGDFDDLLWIMAQESSGVVGTRNPKSTARGLFQLLQAQYGLNPNGERSFGNAVEECQGGIRYIYGRYHSAKRARIFWEKHHWY
ncbi:hypothetical protein [Paracidovorax konjaci]|uniref:aggregation-promoting factor C-terminal-like domain-containing protein n=1 Tax=Paracidovorax konjaci TaxID=32040 RepID=UPI001FE912D7|nr:hypothetical protein [Paracidovorax konjaci]